MNPLNKSKLPEDIDDKMRFVFEQAEKGLDSTISAYDSLANKAFVLLGFLIPIGTALIGFCITQPAKTPALFLPALVYVFFLAWSGWYAWRVIQSRDFVHSGRHPFSFSPDDIRSSFAVLYRDEAKRYQKAIDDTHAHNENCASWLAQAVRLFLFGSLLSLVMLAAVGPLINNARPVGHAPSDEVSNGVPGRGWRGLGGWRDGRSSEWGRGHR